MEDSKPIKKASRWPRPPEGAGPEWYTERIGYMAGFMLEGREAVFRSVLDDRTRYITICTENTFHPQNASALVRTCEAFGLQDIHTVEDLCKFKPHENIVRGTDKWVDIHRHASAAEALDVLRGKGYRIIATTPHTDDSLPEDFDIQAGPFALVFGTEHAGISPEVGAAADGFIKIPMCGFVESLNVSASASILLYILTRRLRESGIDWALGEDEREKILFRWMMSSVKDSRNILKRFEQTKL